jgi:hypothetical protein
VVPSGADGPARRVRARADGSGSPPPGAAADEGYDVVPTSARTAAFTSVSLRSTGSR